MNMILRKSCFRVLYLNCNNCRVLNCHRRRYSMAVEPSSSAFSVCRQGDTSSLRTSLPGVDLRYCLTGRRRHNFAFSRLRCCNSPERRSNNNASTWGGLDFNKRGRPIARILPQELRELVVLQEMGLGFGLGNGFNLNGDGGGGGGACQTINGGGSIQSADERRSSPEKIVVAVDVDEVLGNFISALNHFIADRYSMNHSVSEYHVYEFFKIWNCPRHEADRMVHEFFKTSYFTTGIHPIPGAHETLQKLARFCTLTIVTSRQNVIKDHTLEWIEKHYPNLFQEVCFGNHFALDGDSKPKSEICRSLGAKVLIDDNPKYAIECAEVGIRVLLFDYENSYPWSKMKTFEHPLVTKVRNWEEVEHQLVSIIKS